MSSKVHPNSNNIIGTRAIRKTIIKPINSKERLHCFHRVLSEAADNLDYIGWTCYGNDPTNNNETINLASIMYLNCMKGNEREEITRAGTKELLGMAGAETGIYPTSDDDFR